MLCPLPYVANETSIEHINKRTESDGSGHSVLCPYEYVSTHIFNMDFGFEKVHTQTRWDEGGPRVGIADYRGVLVAFESQYLDENRGDLDMFLIAPISDTAFELAMEDHAIRRRWEAEFNAGRVAMETYPALPSDKARSDELQLLLAQMLKIDAAHAPQVRAEFRGDGAAMRVKWTPVAPQIALSR